MSFSSCLAGSLGSLPSCLLPANHPRSLGSHGGSFLSGPLPFRPMLARWCLGRHRPRRKVPNLRRRARMSGLGSPDLTPPAAGEGRYLAEPDHRHHHCPQPTRSAARPGIGKRQMWRWEIAVFPILNTLGNAEIPSGGTIRFPRCLSSFLVNRPYCDTRAPTVGSAHPFLSGPSTMTLSSTCGTSTSTRCRQ